MFGTGNELGPSRSPIATLAQEVQNGKDAKSAKGAKWNEKPMPVISHLMVVFAVVFQAPEAGKGQAVICQVEKGGMILSLLPDRSLVKKGDIVCELDSADLKDRLVEQTIAAKRAETEYQAARLAHDLAIMASKQYKESSYLMEKAAIQGEIKLPEANLTSTADQLDHTT